MRQPPVLVGSPKPIVVGREDELARLQSREMAQGVEALAAEAPLVLLLEDLHWSDYSTLDLISAIARWSEAARLLVVGTYRSVEMHAEV